MCSHNTPGSTAFLAGGAWPGGGQPPCTEHVPSEYQMKHLSKYYNPYSYSIPKYNTQSDDWQNQKEKNQCEYKYFIDSIKQMKYCKLNEMCAKTWYEYNMMFNQESNPWPAWGSGGV